MKDNHKNVIKIKHIRFYSVSQAVSGNLNAKLTIQTWLHSLISRTCSVFAEEVHGCQPVTKTIREHFLIEPMSHPFAMEYSNLTLIYSDHIDFLDIHITRATKVCKWAIRATLSSRQTTRTRNRGYKWDRMQWEIIRKINFLNSWYSILQIHCYWILKL